MKDKWKKVPILLNLQRVVDIAIFDDLIAILVCNLVEYGGLSETNLAIKLVNFGANGVTIFQVVKSVVTTQLMKKHALFVNDVH